MLSAYVFVCENVCESLLISTVCLFFYIIRYSRAHTCMRPSFLTDKIELYPQCIFFCVAAHQLRTIDAFLLFIFKFATCTTQMLQSCVLVCAHTAEKRETFHLENPFNFRHDIWMQLPELPTLYPVLPVLWVKRTFFSDTYTTATSVKYSFLL